MSGTYILREGSEAYAGDLASQSDLPTPGNAIPWQRDAESTETSRALTRWRQLDALGMGFDRVLQN